MKLITLLIIGIGLGALLVIAGEDLTDEDISNLPNGEYIYNNKTKIRNYNNEFLIKSDAEINCRKVLGKDKHGNTINKGNICEAIVEVQNSINDLKDLTPAITGDGILTNVVELEHIEENCRMEWFDNITIVEEIRYGNCTMEECDSYLINVTYNNKYQDEVCDERFEEKVKDKPITLKKGRKYFKFTFTPTKEKGHFDIGFGALGLDPDYEVTECAYINEGNYILNSSVYSTTTCMTINSSNVSFECASGSQCGIVNERAIFDGDEDWINCGFVNTSGSDEMTVMAWFNPGINTQVSGGIVAADDYGGVNRNYLLASQSTNVDFYVYNDIGTVVVAYGTSSLSRGTWYHVAGVYNGTHVQVYVNGVAEDLTPPALSGPVRISDVDTKIGSFGYASGDLYGQVDEVKIYNRSLSATEINQTYLNESNHILTDVDSTGLVGYWKLDGNALDDTGINNGTAVGDTFYSNQCMIEGDSGVNDHAFSKEAFSNVTIRNCYIKSFGYGFFSISASTDVSLINNTFTGMTSDGIRTYYHNGLIIENNTFDSSAEGFYDFRCQNLNITNNNFTDITGVGIYSRTQATNIIKDNTFTRTKRPIIVADLGTTCSLYNVTNNIAGGKPILFYTSKVSLSDNDNVSQLILCNADGSTVNNITINNTDDGRTGEIDLPYTSDTNITNCHIEGTYYAIGEPGAGGTANNRFENNVFDNSGASNIRGDGQNYNIWLNNTFSRSDAINYFLRSDYNVWENNTFSNDEGVNTFLWWGMEYSNITGNQFLDGGTSIDLYNNNVGLTINKNNFSGSATKYIDDRGCSGITVNDNIFSSSTTYDMELIGDNWVVYNNTFSSPKNIYMFSGSDGHSFYENNFTSTGVVTNAIILDGNGDYITVPDDASFNLTDNFTISLWIYSDGVSGSRDFDTFLSRWEVNGKSYILNFDNSNPEKAKLITSQNGVSDGTSSISTTAIIPKNWYHITGVKNSTHIAIYVNGVLEDSDAITGIYGGDTDVLLGAQVPSSPAQLFKGKMDEVYVYNRTLNSTEINQSYQDGLNNIPSTVSDTDLMAYWKLDGDVLDDTGINNGTAVGDTHYLTYIKDAGCIGCTYNSSTHGNIYAEVLDWTASQIYGTVAWLGGYVAEGGTLYPYSNTTSSGFLDGVITDYLPFTLNLLANNAPTFDQNLTNQTVTVGNTLTYDINCSDADNDTITYYDNSTLFNINSSTGLISHTPVNNQSGTYNITITCGDGTDNTTQSFFYKINPYYAPPTNLTCDTGMEWVQCNWTAVVNSNFTYYNDSTSGLSCGDCNSHFVNIGGDTMSGNLNMAFYNITDIWNLAVDNSIDVQNDIEVNDQCICGGMQTNTADFAGFYTDTWKTNFSNDVLFEGTINVTGSIYNSLSHMFGLSTTNHTVPSGGVWYNISMNSSLSDITPELNFSNNTTLTIDHDGHYTITYGMSVLDQAPSPNAHVAMRINKNGAELLGSYVEIKTHKKDNPRWLEHTTHAVLESGDKLLLQYISDDTTVLINSVGTFSEQEYSAFGYLQEVLT